MELVRADIARAVRAAFTLHSMNGLFASMGPLAVRKAAIRLYADAISKPVHVMP